jgi:hypothetical protein
MGSKKIARQEISEKSLKRIDEQFRRYRKYLFSLVLIYIVFYIIWVSLISVWTRYFLVSQGVKKGKEFWFVVLAAGIIQGILFCMDGVVSALLKSPFNQMCYAINKAEGISYKKKDSIITKATESNEHCKETLKKFGILTIGTEVIRIIVEGAPKAGDEPKFGKWWYLLHISYLIPLALAVYRVWQIRKELDKLKKIRVKKIS